ncbi:hypothetical protein TruAng_010497 [Truncatella angustata]|nr:hypothetical protein TruAng_010497 [Truncatella angustata]
MTVTNQNTAALALPDPYYIFRALTAFGFYTQWIVMIMNGSFVAMVVTNWHGVFPTGTPVKTAWTGIWPIDFVLGLLVVFFGAVNNVADLTDLGPFLMLVDLVFTLVVFNIMTLVEDRRNRKTGPLRFKRSAETPSIPAHQRQALVFTAIWSIIVSLPVLVPSVLGATPFQVQDGVVMWFFAPLTLGIFQDLFGLLVSKTSYGGLKDPISVAYSIVGAFSAVVHIGVAVSPYFCGPEVTWSRIYWPNHNAPLPGSPSFMTEGAMLFMQYDHVVIYLCVFALGAYMLGFDKITSASSLSGKMQAGYPILVLTAMTVITGPGAGLAWLLCQKEKKLRACEEVGDMVEKA